MLACCCRQVNLPSVRMSAPLLFCLSDLGPSLFLPWASWVCLWAALIIMVLALFNACGCAWRRSSAYRLPCALEGARFCAAIRCNQSPILQLHRSPCLRSYIKRFTRFSGELFGGLIAVCGGCSSLLVADCRPASWLLISWRCP